MCCTASKPTQSISKIVPHDNSADSEVAIVSAAAIKTDTNEKG